jgi:hypothetical protein
MMLKLGCGSHLGAESWHAAVVESRSQQRARIRPWIGFFRIVVVCYTIFGSF